MEDKNLVSAHFAALFGDYDLAQELFLKCGCPLEALNVTKFSRKNFFLVKNNYTYIDATRLYAI